MSRSLVSGSAADDTHSSFGAGGGQSSSSICPVQRSLRVASLPRRIERLEVPREEPSRPRYLRRRLNGATEAGRKRGTSSKVSKVTQVEGADATLRPSLRATALV